MPYSIRISPAADREIRKLDRSIQRRILKKLDDLERDPRPNGVEKLSGADEARYRVRVGGYRIVYRIDDDVLTVLVLKVGNRKEIYRNLWDALPRVQRQLDRPRSPPAKRGVMRRRFLLVPAVCGASPVLLVLEGMVS